MSFQDTKMAKFQKKTNSLTHLARTHKTAANYFSRTREAAANYL